MTTDAAVSSKKGKRTRSPNFPFIDLEKGIERTQELYERDKANKVPITTMHDCWGYKKMSGALLQTVAALRAYGLIEDTGTGDARQIKVSEDARKILLDHPDKPRIIRECALRPKVFHQVWHRYKGDGLPSDGVLKHFLIFEYDPPFNEDAVDSFIANFRATMAFSNALGADTEDTNEVTGDATNDAEEPVRELPKPLERTSLPRTAGVKTLSFALVEGDATIQVPYPMTEDSFDMLMGILQLQKRALVPPTNSVRISAEADAEG